jgi:hypothetical protein
LKVGEIVSVEVDEAGEYDLWGGYYNRRRSSY